MIDNAHHMDIRQVMEHFIKTHLAGADIASIQTRELEDDLVEVTIVLNSALGSDNQEALFSLSRRLSEHLKSLGIDRLPVVFTRKTATAA